FAASSYLQYAVNGMPNPALALQTMENNLLTSTPTPWYSNGDTRYIFDVGDPDQWVEINLGQVRQVDVLGASMMIPFADRYVLGHLSIQISLDGTTWTPWGSAPITPASTNPVLIDPMFTSVQYIKYDFGSFGPEYGGGSGVIQLFAEATPLPSTWTMLLLGL